MVTTRKETAKEKGVKTTMTPTVEVDNTNQTQDISSGNDVEMGLVSEIETKTYREEIYQQSLDILQALG